jgi:hypothetical protein
VHDFRTSATTGILVHLIDPDSALVSQAIFFIDKMIEKVTLMVAFTCARSFDPRDVVSVVKGDEFGRRVPSLESQRSNCVGVEVQGSGGELVCFHFPEPASADDFHACMKVLCKTLRNVPPLGTPRSTNRPSPRRLSPRDEPAASSGRMRFVQARAA